MKQLTKEAQMQKNGGLSVLMPWQGQCTSCYVVFQAWTQKSLQDKGYQHYVANYTKTQPHRWAYLKKGY